MNSERRNLIPASHFPKLEIAYSLLYLSLIIPGIAFVVWYECAYRVRDTAPETVYAIFVGIGYVGVADAAVTVGVIEGGIAIMVLARRMLERATQRGKEEGKEAGREENQKMWEGWNRRRLISEAEGHEFNEPPPRLDDEEYDR